MVKLIIRILAITALAMTLIPSILHFTSRISTQDVNRWMLIGMLLWFATGSLWLGKKRPEEQN